MSLSLLLLCDLYMLDIFLVKSLYELPPLMNFEKFLTEEATYKVATQPWNYQHCSCVWMY